MVETGQDVNRRHTNNVKVPEFRLKGNPWNDSPIDGVFGPRVED